MKHKEDNHMEDNLPIEQWREEKARLLESKKHLESSRMSAAYHEGADAFRPFLREAIAEFGEKHVKMLLAHTARNLDDGRIDRASKKWANAQLPIPHPVRNGESRQDEPKPHSELMVSKHPTILNQAIREIIKMDKQPVRGGEAR